MTIKKVTEEMTIDQMKARLVELEAANVRLEAAKTDGVKEQVKRLIESGFNTIESIATELDKTSKNISSNLTYLRKDLAESGQTIISQRINSLTYVTIQPMSIFGI